MYYRLSPDVAGGFGEGTEVDTRTVPLTVHRLHYEFEGWLGDCLLESYPAYILEESAARELVKRKFTGFEIRHVTVTTSDVFKELQGDVVLPNFVWLHVTGVPGVEDLGVRGNGELVVSQDVLDVLQQHGIENCEIERYSGDLDNPS